jgi:hypothetical protein
VKTLGQFITRRRKDLGINQKELAALLKNRDGQRYKGRAVAAARRLIIAKTSFRAIGFSISLCPLRIARKSDPLLSPAMPAALIQAFR